MSKLKKDKLNSAVYFLNSTLGSLIGRQVDGMLFGVEIEVEGQGVALEGVPSKNWQRKPDGSLRGESMEYVFSKPCPYGEALKRVDRLFSAFEKNKVKLHNSHRTSTHVHLNFSDKTMKQVIMFFFVHTILEDMLATFCGESRKGNLFCVSARDTDLLVDELDNAVFLSQNLFNFNDDMKYAAANLGALSRFGSIEIRTMRGADTPEELKDWLEILNQVYEYACDPARTPADLVESMSMLGPDNFLRSIFRPETLAKLLSTWPVTNDIRMSLLNGIRTIQLFAYKLQDIWNYEKISGVKKGKVLEPLGAAAFNNVRVHGRYAFEKHDGRTWLVPPRIIEAQVVDTVPDDPNYYYDPDLDTIVHEPTDRPMRWVWFGGNEVPLGSELDRQVNWRWYEVAEQENEAVGVEDFEWDDGVREED